jgi:EmrB/QacA subfamily drug resistance transporter
VLSAFLSALDTTILSTVMPTIVADLGGLSLYSWVFAVYMVMTAVSMPVWGRLADMLGKRPLFVAAVTIFLGGSVLCGFSRTMVQLILFRGIQGIGAGGLSSVPFALLSTFFEPHERGKALGAISSAWGISSVVGPGLGSAIVTLLDWRWVFFINLPVGATAIALILRNYKETAPEKKESIDFVGAALLAFSIIALLLSARAIGEGGEDNMASLGIHIVATTVLLISFILWERVAASPLLAMGYFRRRAFWLGNLEGFLGSFVAYSFIAFVPFFAQAVQGGTPVQAGLVITPMSLAWSLASIGSGRLVARVGENAMIRLGIVFLAAGFGATLLIKPDTSVIFLMTCAVLVGLGMGSQTPALLLSVQHSLSHQELGIATATQMLARTIGGAIGISVLGALLTGSMDKTIQADAGLLAGLSDQLRSLVHDPQKLLAADVRHQLTPTQLGIVLAAFTDALHRVFAAGLILTMATLILSIFLPPSTLHRTLARHAGER